MLWTTIESIALRQAQLRVIRAHTEVDQRQRSYVAMAGQSHAASMQAPTSVFDSSLHELAAEMLALHTELVCGPAPHLNDRDANRILVMIEALHQYAPRDDIPRPESDASGFWLALGLEQLERALIVALETADADADARNRSNSLVEIQGGLNLILSMLQPVKKNIGPESLRAPIAALREDCRRLLLDHVEPHPRSKEVRILRAPLACTEATIAEWVEAAASEQGAGSSASNG